MTNHVHLLIETSAPNLGTGMHALQGRYARYFNRRHGHVGHLFQDRYGAVRITSDEQLVATVKYIDANPVSAGLCLRPQEWPWGSAAALAAGEHPDWLDVERLRALAIG